MKKSLLLCLIVISCLCLMALLGGCLPANGQDGKDGLDGKDGINGTDGKDGVGIQGVQIVDGELIIILTEGEPINLGNIVGADGKDGTDGKDGVDGKDGIDGINGADGKDGVDGTNGANGKDGDSVVGATVLEDGMLVLNFASGKTVEVGDVVTANGKDGVGIEDIQLDNGNLTVKLTSGAVLQLGNVNGVDGVGVQKAQIDNDGNLVLTYTNQTSVNLGKVVGTNGTNGINGKDGVGIQKVQLDDNGNLSVSLTDGSVMQLGNVKGKDGVDGKNVLFRVDNNWLQWKYDVDTDWTNLYEINGTPPSEGLVKLTYVLSGGAMPSGTPTEIEVTAGTSIYLPVPSYHGYTFEGWYLQNGTKPVTSPYRVHQSHKLYAKWQAGAIITGKKIYTLDDLANVANNLGGTYVLMNDINCQGLALPAIGADSTTAFRGIFDGQGYTISNYVASPSLYVGLFGYNSGIIRNLRVADFNLTIHGSFASGNFYIGGIAGYNAGTISNCVVDNGIISVKITNKRYGGLISGENSGTITNCSVNGTVRIDQDVESTATAMTGGITAHNNAGTVSNCFATGYFYAYGYGKAGVGRWSNSGEVAVVVACNVNKGVVENCLAFGTVEGGNGRKGDVCCYHDATLTNCYKDELLTCTNPTATVGTAMSRASLSNATFYRVTLGWDSEIWDYSNLDLDNGIFPTLKAIRATYGF